MALRLELFDGTKTYMFPNGALATPDIFRRDFMAIDYFPHVLELNGNVCQAVQELGALRNINNIDESLTDAEAIFVIQDIVNAPQPVAEPSAEERIASALEYQNLLATIASMATE